MDQKELDVRSLCGIKNCTRRAIVLAAWPKRNPVPLCQEDMDVIRYVVGAKNLTPEQWLQWINENGKPHILPSYLSSRVN